MKHTPDQAGHSTEYHVPWAFRREAFVFDGEQLVRLNFHAAATELHAWMEQAGKLSIFADHHRPFSTAISNPYTYHLSSITLILAEVINSCYDFSVAEQLTNPEYAEITRIRLNNELVLYYSRFYEAAVKQMLFLTTISPRRYKNSAIGRLLTFDCRPCRKVRKPHSISLLGSLAHPYKLCLELENCLYVTMKKFNVLRNSDAAHATTQNIGTRTTKQSQEQLGRDQRTLGTEFLHSLEHLAKLEQAFLSDLTRKCNSDA